MVRKTIYLSLFLLSSVQVIFAQEIDFQNFKSDFLVGYEKLNIPPIRIAYLETLNDIPSSDILKRQDQFFRNMLERSKRIKRQNLSHSELLELLVISYETKLNLTRIQLSKSWQGNIPAEGGSIHDIKEGKQWYNYLLKRWVDIEVNPDSLFAFGKREVDFVKGKMDKIRRQLDLSPQEFQVHLNDSSFFIHNSKSVQLEFEETRERMKKKLSGLFPYTNQIKDAQIAKGTNPNLAQVPAYYNSDTFYFNYFDKPFNKRQIEWIYAHEAFPGHHYQVSSNTLLRNSQLLDLFWYPGFVEGWGAYVEYLDIYSTPMDEYGKWEWDLIRSVRVVLDLGINYYGWNDEQALAYWKNHIDNQDDIAIREINRMKRWPAQVITYKYGAKALLEMLASAQKSKNFSYTSFHESLLKHGDIPISILQMLVPFSRDTITN